MTRDIYKVLEILTDSSTKKQQITWSSQEFSSFREASFLKNKRQKFNMNPDVEYKVKMIPAQNILKTKSKLIS